MRKLSTWYFRWTRQYERYLLSWLAVNRIGLKEMTSYVPSFSSRYRLSDFWLASLANTSNLAMNFDNIYSAILSFSMIGIISEENILKSS